MTRETAIMHLRLIDERIQLIRDQITAAGSEFPRNEGAQAAVQLWLLQAIESCVKLSIAVLAHLHCRSADSYKGAFETLYRKNQIPENLKNRMCDLVDVRHAAVHVYWEEDPQAFIENLPAYLETIEQFSQTISKIVTHDTQ